MSEVLLILHVVGAVFIVGPMAILPMTGMRAVRAGQPGPIRTLASSTSIFAWLSVVVVLLGFARLGTDTRHPTPVTAPWVLISIIAWLVAAVLTLFVVVPALRRAAADLSGTGAGSAGAESTAASPAGSTAASAPRYPQIAAASGIASLLLLVVVVMMVWRP